MDNNYNNALQKHQFTKNRRAGVLLHLSSLPGYSETGDIGNQAYRFIDFLKENSFKVWQMLPLNPTHSDNAPYKCLSTHAGNPCFISLDWLQDKGWLDSSLKIASHHSKSYRKDCIIRASIVFNNTSGIEWSNKIESFIHSNSYWLADYAMYMTLKIKYDNSPWYEWPDKARSRDKAFLEDIKIQYKDIYQSFIFEQFVFYAQWKEVHEYAKSNNIELFGDLAIFVSTDSADVWSRIENFEIDVNGVMKYKSGAPPDDFSETGQIWGNPLYDWEYLKSTKFKWWKERFQSQLNYFDMVRIDHFRGLEACWAIPSGDDTAVNGYWKKSSGSEMLEELQIHFGELPLVAEDLGLITKEVIELKNKYRLPGMRVLQFAFNGERNNPHLPHEHVIEDVVYTGTHDNDTTLGWVSDIDKSNDHRLKDYLGYECAHGENKALHIMRLALSSVSFLCVLPMQDLLMLDSSARMNFPGKSEGNWQWRFDWSQLRPDIMQCINKYISIYER